MSWRLCNPYRPPWPPDTKRHAAGPAECSASSALARGLRLAQMTWVLAVVALTKSGGVAAGRDPRRRRRVERHDVKVIRLSPVPPSGPPAFPGPGFAQQPAGPFLALRS